MINNFKGLEDSLRKLWVQNMKNLANNSCESIASNVIVHN